MAVRYFVQLSYDGSPFHGWQIQNNAKTIQQILNEALSTNLRTEIYCVGCGRTDTGVHALTFFAHFDLSEPIEQTESVTFHVNCLLPKEIAIQRIFQVDADMHARFSALSRTYEYLITTHKNPFAIQRMWELKEALDLEAMQHAAQSLLQFHDFTSFSKLHTDNENNLCELMEAQWTSTADGYKFTIKANRFLRNMVRAIVGTCIEVGKNKINLEQFKAIVEAKDRSKAGFSVPAHGLYLVNVAYPEGVIS